jgi:hypothetical protein
VLAQLLTRVAENRVKVGWELIRERVKRITLTELTTDRASVLQTKTLSKEEREIFNCCSAPPPPKILQGSAT